MLTHPALVVVFARMLNAPLDRDLLIKRAAELLGDT